MFSGTARRVSNYRNAIVRSKTEKRTYIADEWDQCRDFGGLTFRVPMDKVSFSEPSKHDISCRSAKAACRKRGDGEKRDEDRARSS